MAHAPIVYISSTTEDLQEYREQAAKAARALGFFPLMMEDFPANGRGPALDECLRQVDKAELLIAIVAHRYGWVPDEPVNSQSKSITWLECERAWNFKKEVLAFLVDADYPWKPESFEAYRLVSGRARPNIIREVERNERGLAQFKRRLSESFCRTFTDPPSLRALVGEALGNWRARHPAWIPLAQGGDPEHYLKSLEDDSRFIRIRGLKTRRSEPYVFNIEEIYIPLATLDDPGTRTGLDRDRIALERAFSNRKVVIVGVPGSGKTTFLRRVAFELCRSILQTETGKSESFLSPTDRRFPILIRTADFARFIAGDNAPKSSDSPDWIPYFLGVQSEAYKWGLDQTFFRRRLEEGRCLVMLDGLDESPERRLRERVARILERATTAYERCDFLVTTRPRGYEGDSVLAGFVRLSIADLEPPEIKAFLAHFARALSLPERQAMIFQETLIATLADRPEIRSMAGNPVMLTALATLQHNDQRLPEYRVELYEAILGWLAAAREEKEGRLSIERRLAYLRKLAFYMQSSAAGRVVQINKRVAAELIATELGGSVEQNEDLLELEAQDSAIISSIGTDLKFWHLSFQEYLAAREVAGFSGKHLAQVVKSDNNLFYPQSREMMRLLAGILKQQGEQRIDELFQAILDTLGDRPTLQMQTRCAALLCAMMRDLAPMGYQPGSAKYEETVKAVMRIFETGEAEEIDIETRIEAADLLGQMGDPRLDEDNWVTIPAGSFAMGAQSRNPSSRNFDPDACDDEAPVHEVELRDFQIGKFPVTVKEFSIFLAGGGYSDRQFWSRGFGRFHEPQDWHEQEHYPSRPVVGVSWYEAAAYCSWAGGRLPGEAEWERAARGLDAKRYPWGTAPLDLSRSNYDSRIGHPTPVGLYPTGSTPEGLADILGNVWEWVGDRYGAYPQTTGDEPPESGGRQYILRGGSWIDRAANVRPTRRAKQAPNIRDKTIGFRCVKSRSHKSTTSQRLRDLDSIWSKLVATAAKDEPDGNAFRAISRDLIAGLLREAIGYRVEYDIPYYRGITGCMIEAPFLWIRCSRFPILVVDCHRTSRDLLGDVVKQLEIAKATEYFALIILISERPDSRNELQLAANTSAYPYDFILLDQDELTSIIEDGSSRQLVEVMLKQGIDIASLSPYVVRGPVPDRMFFGREKVVKQITKNIQTNSFAIVGGRRAGKSSTMLRVLGLLNHDPRFKAVYLNLEDVFSYGDFKLLLANTFGVKIQGGDSFDFRYITSAIVRANKDVRVVLLLDEVDQLLASDTGGIPPGQLFKAFRSVSHENLLKFVFSGGRTLYKHLKDPQSPFFNFCEAVALKSLEPQSIVEIVSKPMRQLGIEVIHEDFLIDRIIDLTSCHPNLTQWLCDRLVRNSSNRRVSPEDLDRISTSVDFYEHYVSTGWGEASAMEKLVSLASEDLDFSTKALFGKLASYGVFDKVAILEAVDMLKLYNMIDQKGSNLTFSLRHFPRISRLTMDLSLVLAGLIREVKGPHVRN